MKKTPQLYKFSEIKHRLQTLEPGKSYIKPFVTSKVSDTMCGGINFFIFAHNYLSTFGISSGSIPGTNVMPAFCFQSCG